MCRYVYYTCLLLGESLGAHESPQFPRIMHTKAHTLTYTYMYAYNEKGIIYL